MTLKDLAIDHDYYASENNFYSNDAKGVFDNWDAFYREFGEADIDMNLVYRWDISEGKRGYYMQVFIIQQRKGIYTPVFINSIEEKDVIQIIAFLKPHLEKIKAIWSPFK